MNKLFIPREYQKPLLVNFTKRLKKVKEHKTPCFLFICVKWPRRHGKDKVCFTILANEMLSEVGNYFYVFPTKEDARDAFWQAVGGKDGQEPLLSAIPETYIERRDNNGMRIILKNGSTISVKCTDDRESILLGTNVKGIVFSEAASTNSNVVLNSVIPSVKQARGFVLVNSTPEGKNHFYEVWEGVKKAYNEGKFNYYIDELQCLYPDKPNYTNEVFSDPSEIWEEAKILGMNEEDVKAFYGTEFKSNTTGSFFGEALDQAREDKRIGHFPPGKSIPTDCLYDLGWSDYTVVWFRQVVNNKCVFVDCLVTQFQGIDSIISMVYNKGYTIRNHYLPHDAGYSTAQNQGVTLERQFKEVLRKSHYIPSVYVCDKPKKVVDSISLTLDRFKEYFFNETYCGEQIELLYRYRAKFNKKTRTFSDTPVEDKPAIDIADALRTEALAYKKTGYWGLNKNNNLQLQNSGVKIESAVEFKDKL